MSASFPDALPIIVRIAATAYPARIPNMKGISFPNFFPYTEQAIVTPSVTSPQISATRGSATAAPSASLTPPVTISPTAFPASERPIIATVGPITTAGMSLSIQSTPTILTISAIMTYTSPAKTAPRISPKYPTATEDAPANAAAIEPRNANEEPKNTGLFFLVKNT